MIELFTNLIKKAVSAGKRECDYSLYANSDYFTVQHGTINSYTLISPTRGSSQGNYRACDWSRWMMHWLATSGGMQVVNDYCTRTNQDPLKVVPYILNRMGAVYKDETNKYRQITNVFLGWHLAQFNKYAISIDTSDENVVTFKLTNLIGDTVVTTINKVRVPPNAMLNLNKLIAYLDGYKIHDVTFPKWEKYCYHSLEEIISVLSKAFYDENTQVIKDHQQDLIFINDTLTLAVEPIEA